MKSSIVVVAACLLVAAACLPAVSAAWAASDGKSLYLEHCAGCHGKDGAKAGGAAAPPAGQNSQAVYAKLRGYADGSEGGKLKNIMLNVTRKLDDAGMRAVSDYIETLPAAR
ncbi:MAG: c-type cytochrome [Desulfovibrio sp.]|jgi:cytochrome c|nr:c-type cytochrome [Desulfovibrio sp.]